MASEQVSTPASTLNIKSVLAELEVPFPPEQVQWRVTKYRQGQETWPGGPLR